MSSDCIDNYHVWPYAIWKHLCSDQTAGNQLDFFVYLVLIAICFLESLSKEQRCMADFFQRFHVYSPYSMVCYLVIVV